MKKVVVVAVVILALAGLTYAAAPQAQKRFMEPGRHFHRGPMWAFSMLDLTDDQKHQIAVILKNHRDQSREDLTALRDARKALREVLFDRGSNENAVRSAYRKVAASGEVLTVRMAKMMSELRSVLTPEQLELMKKHKAYRMERRQAMRRIGRSFLKEWIDLHSR